MCGRYTVTLFPDRLAERFEALPPDGDLTTRFNVLPMQYLPAFRNRRCLVIADGFYEWEKTPAGKVPVRVTLKSGEPFAFAGG